MFISVRINRKAESRIASGHPWIFRSDVLDTAGARGGDVVIVSGGRRQLGIAHFSASSKIALRMLSPHVEPVDASFFRKRIEAALAFRRQIVHGTDAYRLIHAEADALPALIVDRYANFFVAQMLDQGMDRATPDIVSALVDLFQPEGILARNDAAVRTQEELPRETRLLHGAVPPSVGIAMNGLHLRAALHGGMKTGIFLDQRENYVAAAHWARGVALDCFTSTGGFALHMSSRCEWVEAIDSSAPALETARANAAANAISNIDFRQADVFDTLAGYAAAHRRFDTVVLDPPAFAKSRAHLDSAARAYKEINRRAFQLLAPGGILVTCSCSHHLSEADLLALVAEASVETGRRLRIVERRAQASDHPVLLTVPETLYLKCLLLQDIPA